MELLFFHPDRFGSIELYTLMNAVKGKVQYGHGMLAADPAAARRFLGRDLADDLAAALATLRNEIDRRLEPAGG